MPTDVETSFKIWWRGLDPSVELEVRYPYDRHGNAGKTSNSAKTGIMQDFLELVFILNLSFGMLSDRNASLLTLDAPLMG